MHKNTFLHNIQTNVGYKVEGLDMREPYTVQKGYNFIPPFMAFDNDKFSIHFFNLPVYTLDKADEDVPGTSYKFSDICSGPFIAYPGMLHHYENNIQVRSIDDFFISYNGEKTIIWDKPGIPERIDYVHGERPPRLSEPMIFKPLIDMNNLSPKALDYDQIKIGCPDYAAYRLIQNMNFDTLRQHTANRFFTPKMKKSGWDTGILFKTKPYEYAIIMIDYTSRIVGRLDVVTYDADAPKGSRVKCESIETITGLSELSKVIKDIKRQRDKYVEKQYIH